MRNARTSTHLASALEKLQNVHVLEADVTDYRSLEVCVFAMRITRSLTLSHMQHAVEEVSKVTGGTLDFLIHNAARMEGDSIMKNLDDL